jgi:hypothetical protein
MPIKHATIEKNLTDRGLAFVRGTLSMSTSEQYTDEDVDYMRPKSYAALQMADEIKQTLVIEASLTKIQRDLKDSKAISGRASPEFKVASTWRSACWFQFSGASL